MSVCIDIDKNGKSSIGLATSNDGFIWTRLSDEPIFQASEDILAWDSGNVGSPCLVWLSDVKRWRMYYVGSSLDNNGGESVSVLNNGFGVAESLDEDGIYFKRVIV